MTSTSRQPTKIRVDFFAFLPLGQHPGMDALARGLAAGVKERGGTLRLRHASTTDALDEAVARAAAQDAVDAIFIFVTHPNQPSAKVIQAVIQGGTPVYTIHRPWYSVTGSIVVPNFYHGVTLANRLAQELYKDNNSNSNDNDERPKIAILGGPAIVDDEELVLGCLDGAQRAQLAVLNDPFQTEFRNLHDIKGASRAVVKHLFETCGAKMQGLIVFNDETLHDVMDYLIQLQNSNNDKDDEDNNASPQDHHKPQISLLGRLPIVSRNGSPQAIAWVRQGWTTATLDYQLPEIGRLAAFLLDDDDHHHHHHHHNTTPNGGSSNVQIMAPLGTLYDASNVDEYTPWETRAPVTTTPLVVLPNNSNDTTTSPAT